MSYDGIADAAWNETAGFTGIGASLRSGRRSQEWVLGWPCRAPRSH
jgi:hypothetical protein